MQTDKDPSAGFGGARLEQLDAYLRQRVAGFAGMTGIERLHGGQSNPTYKLQADEDAFVLRTRPAPVAELLPSAHAIDREYRVMSALRGAKLPVPRTICFCDDESVLGVQFYLMEFVRGRVFWDPSLPGLNPGERAAIYDEMNRVLAQLHSVDPHAAGLGDFGRSGNYFARQIRRWTHQYKASETEEIEAMERLIDWLPRHVPAQGEAAVVHGDFRLDNLVFDLQEPRVIAVLDWELSTIGDPLADFAYHCLKYRIAPDLFRGIAGLDLPGLQIPQEHTYVAAYCERTGRDAVANWDYYMAYNLFRLAAILQGVAKRARQGIAASREGAEVGTKARALAELGWEAAERAVGKPWG